MPYILALDEGTTSARAAVYDGSGRRLTMVSRPIACRYPQPGWVEQDAEELWRAQLDAARCALAAAGIRAADLRAIGIANQRETTVVWDRTTGAPVAPAIVWQCRRTADYCAALASSPAAEAVSRATGLIVDAYFSASKIRWILDNVPDAPARASAGDLLFGTVDTWLIWNLTGGAVHATDVTNASRTMLMNLETGDWAGEMLDLFGVPRAMLPRIVASSGVVGLTDAALFGAPVEIAGIAGDQQAALAGQACFRAGQAKNTYGTGCFALLHTGGRPAVSRNRLVSTRAASPRADADFAIEGSVFVAGAAVQWLRDGLGIIGSAEETAAIAASVPDTGGVCIVPAFVGLGAPHWDAQARGLITGITRSTGRAEIVRATLEAIAYQVRELIDAMQDDAGEQLAELRVDGAAAANDFLMQFQADILGRPVVRPADIETTALGAAYLAGLAAGVWSGPEELESFWRAERLFEPAMDESRREELFAAWKKAVERARS
ncbi:MAG: glycerol kinase GlpK [bacterium]